MNEHALSRRPELLVAAAGLGVGVATAIGQTYLDGALNALVNSVSAWLVAAFLVGSRMRSDRGAMVAGLCVCALQLVGYYVTAELRGFPLGGTGADRLLVRLRGRGRTGVRPRRAAAGGWSARAASAPPSSRRRSSPKACGPMRTSSTATAPPRCGWRSAARSRVGAHPRPPLARW